VIIRFLGVFRNRKAKKSKLIIYSALNPNEGSSVGGAERSLWRIYVKMLEKNCINTLPKEEKQLHHNFIIVLFEKFYKG
jgi:hypothetical protein